jgi:hypothetical protein
MSADENNKELSARDKLKELLNNGVKGIMNSEDYKNYLDTRGRVYQNNFSFVNATLVFLQKPDAEHVMGYNAWKYFGRIPAQGSKGAQILIPKFIGNSKSEAKKITNVLYSYRNRYPGQDFVCYKLGTTGKEIAMNRAGIIGLRDKGKDVKIFKNEDSLVKYLDSFSDPVGWTVGSVFSQADVCVPDNLWIKFNSAVDSVDDIVLDNNDKPIKSKKGEVLIVNTPERQARFRPALDMSVEIQDPEKVSLLKKACAILCAEKGVFLVERTADEDAIIKDGARGYYQKENYHILVDENTTGGGIIADANKYPNGIIVLDKNLDESRKMSTFFHELAHADLHKNLDTLSSELGIERISKTMREHQAESVAFAVASKFGIDTGKKTFNYLAAWSTGFALEELNKSMSAIYREVQALTKGLSMALERMGYDLELCPIVVNELVADKGAAVELPDAIVDNNKLLSPSSYMEIINSAKSAAETRSASEHSQSAQVRISNISPVIT